MKVVKLALLPSTSGKDIMRRNACLVVGHVIVQEDRMLHSHRPQASISNVRAVDGGVKHHRSGYCHDGLDVPFSNSIVMMSARSCEANHLFKLGKVRGELFGGERGTVVGKKGLYNNSQVSAQ